MLEAAGDRIVLFELPVQHGHDVSDATILQRLRPPQGYEASERISTCSREDLRVRKHGLRGRRTGFGPGNINFPEFALKTSSEVEVPSSDRVTM